MQVAYGTQAFQLQQAALNQGADMRNYREPARSVFRLQVHNVPQYLSLEEFRNQFMKLEGCVNAFVEKSDTGIVSGYYVDFVTQDLAEKGASTMSNWKGWGPKGLALQRIGHLAAELKRHQADGDAYLPAKHARMAPRDEPPQKQDGLNTLMQMATGAQYQMNSSGMQPSAMQQPGMQHAQDRSGTVGGAPNAMYPRNGGAYGGPSAPPAANAGGRMQQQGASSQPTQMQSVVQQPMQSGMPPGMVQPAVQLPQQQGQVPSQAYQQPTQGVPQLAPPPQQVSQPVRQQQMMTGPVDSLNSTQPQSGSVMQPVGYNGQPVSAPGSSQAGPASPPNVQYIQLADGSIRAMVPVQGDVTRGPQADAGPSQEPQKPPAALQAPPMSQVNAPSYPNTINSGPPEYAAPYSTVRDQPGGDYQQMIGGPEMRPGVADPGIPLESTVGRDIPRDSGAVPDQGPVLPADATETLYVEDVPTDMSKRELSHIFRPFGGFKEVRIVSKTKEDKSFSFAFAEFETAECAAAALSCLHGYQFDPDSTDLGVMRLRYARGGSHKNTRGGGMNQGHQDGKNMRQDNPQNNRRGAPQLQKPGPAPTAPGQLQRPHDGGGRGNRGQGPRHNQGGRQQGGAVARNNNINNMGWRGQSFQ